MTDLLENIETEINEYSFGGILICGINWGGNSDDVIDSSPKTFFSDQENKKWNFRNRILKWFESWGHLLKTDVMEIGRFEKSITYTNWLGTKSPNMDGKNVFFECSTSPQLFIETINYLKPSIIMFASCDLQYALNSESCISHVTHIFGIGNEPKYLQKDVFINGEKLRKFSVGFQEFVRCDIIALPHPTGSWGLSDSYIASFGEEISQVLVKWKIINGVLKLIN